ncbi:endocuticle structural glycoprotein SgAbd-8-like [Cylas formicarius]|uniref:endocuticle structural glycoprotein SgAbd-8-like n=1 Tax=Cylas formicarius TaxID=197179 RepID=UPI00295859FA|nr:endocuticle structural glycoprotein SgAbd-8-like [Cylas formicarius]
MDGSRVALLLCVLIACVGGCLARTRGRDRILLFSNNFLPNDYNFRYLTEDRSYREESGRTVKRGIETIMRVRGKFYYTGPDGRVYETVYEADENGYRPRSRILGGIRYPYPERFPQPYPDPIPPFANDDVTSLTGSGFGAKLPSDKGRRPTVRPNAYEPKEDKEETNSKIDYYDNDGSYSYKDTEEEKRETKEKSTTETSKNKYDGGEENARDPFLDSLFGS